MSYIVLVQRREVCSTRENYCTFSISRSIKKVYLKAVNAAGTSSTVVHIYKHKGNSLRKQINASYHMRCRIWYASFSVCSSSSGIRCHSSPKWKQFISCSVEKHGFLRTHRLCGEMETFVKIRPLPHPVWHCWPKPVQHCYNRYVLQYLSSTFLIGWLSSTTRIRTITLVQDLPFPVLNLPLQTVRLLWAMIHPNLFSLINRQLWALQALWDLCISKVYGWDRPS